MKRIACLLLFSLLLGGCGSKPTPVWVITGNQQLESFKQQFLTGGSPSIAERHFQRALEEIKKAGDLDLLGKVWLTRMALEVAVLKEMNAGEYLKVAAALPVPANRNFYLFLKGEKDAVDRSLLPSQYASFVGAFQRGSLVETERAIAAMQDDPLSLLIAAGIAVRDTGESETLLKVAVDTASQNGWKRALQAWLERLRSLYDMRGETVKAAAVGQRLDLMK